jgi:hypothetical protein
MVAKGDNRLGEELRKLIGMRQGRAHADTLVELISAHPEWHDELMGIYLSDDEPFSRKLAWAIDIFSEKHPGLIIPYNEIMAEKVAHFSHDGMKRHTLHMLSRIPLPEERLGVLVSACFNWLLEPGIAPAIKVYSMEILFRVALNEPEISKELRDCIEIRLEEESPGFRNRGMKILRRLSRL